MTKNNNKKIICLIGKSAVGKDTIINLLQNNKEKLDGNILKKGISYTTRPPRKNEKNDVDYHFVSEREFLNIRDENGFIEETYYEVNGSVWRYGFAKNEFKDDGNYIIIINPRGLQSFTKSEFKDCIIPVYLTCSDEEREKRYLKRDPENIDLKKQWEARKIQDDIDFDDIYSLLTKFKTFFVIDTETDTNKQIIKMIKGLL